MKPQTFIFNYKYKTSKIEMYILATTKYNSECIDEIKILSDTSIDKCQELLSDHYIEDYIRNGNTTFLHITDTIKTPEDFAEAFPELLI